LVNFYNPNLRKKVVNSVLKILKKEVPNNAYVKFLFSLIFYDYIKKPEKLIEFDPYYFQFITKALSTVNVANDE
jgi:hypothetical protein